MDPNINPLNRNPDYTHPFATHPFPIRPPSTYSENPLESPSQLTNSMPSDHTSFHEAPYPHPASLPIPSALASYPISVPYAYPDPASLPISSASASVPHPISVPFSYPDPASLPIPSASPYPLSVPSPYPHPASLPIPSASASAPYPISVPFSYPDPYPDPASLPIPSASAYTSITVPPTPLPTPPITESEYSSLSPALLNERFPYGSNTVHHDNSKYDNVLREYIQKIAEVRFFETYSNTQIYITTNVELQELKLKYSNHQIATNYLLEISSNETKLKGLSQLFEEFKINLVNAWFNSSPLIASLFKSFPHIVFNLDDFNELDFHLTVKPILDFKKAILSKNLLSELEIKVIITILCDSLSVFLTKNNFKFLTLNEKERNDLFYLIEILRLRGNTQNVKPKKVDLGFGANHLFLKHFVYQYQILSFEEILNAYSIEASAYSVDKKINKFFTIKKEWGSTYSPKLMVISTIISTQVEREVLIYSLKINSNKLNLPKSVSQHKSLKFPKKINNPIDTQLLQLKSLLEQGQPIQEFDKIRYFPNLLIDSSINHINLKKFELALNKYREKKFEVPKYNAVYNNEGSIVFIPIDHPHLADVKIKSLKQLFDETLVSLPEWIEPTYVPNPPPSSAPISSPSLPSPTTPSSSPVVWNPNMSNIPSTLYINIFQTSSRMFTLNIWDFLQHAKIDIITSHSGSNYLDYILHDPKKMSFLTEKFNYIKGELILTWGSDEVRLLLRMCLSNSNPFLNFDIGHLHPIMFHQIVLPFLKFKDSIDNSKLFTDVEIKIIMSFLFKSLHISISKLKEDIFKLPIHNNIRYIIDILTLMHNKSQTDLPDNQRFNLGDNDYDAFITLYLKKLKNISFEKILGEHELKEARNNSNVIAYKLDREFKQNNLFSNELRLLIVPKQNLTQDHQLDVSLFPLEFKFDTLGLPRSYRYKSIDIPTINVLADDLIKLIFSNNVHSEFDRIDMYPKLLVDKRCNSLVQLVDSQLGRLLQIKESQTEVHFSDYFPLIFIPEYQPLLQVVKIKSLDELYKFFSNEALPPSTPLPPPPNPSNPPPNPSNPPPITPSTPSSLSTPPTPPVPSSANEKSSMEFYNLNFQDLTLDKLKTIEIPHDFKMKWSNVMNGLAEIMSQPKIKEKLLKSLIYSLKTDGRCLFFKNLDPQLLKEFRNGVDKLISHYSPSEQYILSRLINQSPIYQSDLNVLNFRKLDCSFLDLNELGELFYNYKTDLEKLKASNYNDILKFKRFDEFKLTRNEFINILDINNTFQFVDLLPPKAKPCFYLVRPPEEENPEIHCFQIYMNEVYDIYAIGKDTPENDVSNHLASILGIDRSLLLPSSYGEGFSLKNSELDLLWKYYAAHPEEFILFSSLSMQQNQEEFDGSATNSVKKGKTGKRRIPEPNSVPSFPDKLKTKRRKQGSEGPDLDEDASMEDPSQPASLPSSESEGSQNPDSAQLAVLPSMPLTSTGYKLPEMNLSNPFASLMFKLTQQSMGFVKKHLEKVEKYTLKNDDQLFSITSSLRQRMGVQTHTMSQFYCASLKEYQQDSASWMLNMSKNRLGGILASEPGLGKTLTAIEWLMQQQKVDSSHRPILIVVPKTIASQWRESLYLQNQNWLTCQFAQLIQKAKDGENINLALVCDYLNIFVQSHLTEIAVLEKRLKGLPYKENGEENPTHSYVRLQLENRHQWLQEAQNLYDDLFFNAPIIPHMIAQWKTEINQHHLSQEERERFGRKFALIASNIIEKLLLKDIPDWGLRVEKGLKSFGLFKYGKLLNTLKPALQQKNMQEIRTALCSYQFQYNEDVKNLGQLLESLSPLSQPSAALNSENDSATAISPEIGIRSNFYSLVNVISEPPKSYAELTPLKVNIEKPYSILITTKDTLRVLRRNNQSASQKSLEKRKEKENFIDFLKTLSWGGVIWDEAQLQVWDLSQGEGENESSFAYRFLKSLSQHAVAREMPIMLLTGTPFVNTYGDTLSLLSMANPHISLQSYGVEILNREARLKSALENLERAKKIQIESQEKNEASIKRCTRSFLKCLENVIVAYAHMKKVQASLVRVNRFDDQNVQQSWTTEQGVKLLPQKEAIEISCALKPKQKELIRSIQQGFKSGEKSLFRLLDSSHKIVFHPDLNGKKLVDRSNPELEAIKKKIKAFNAEEQNKFIDESGFLTAFFKGLETASEQSSASFQISPFKEALKTPESILIIVSRIFEGVILKQLLENQFKYENRTNAKVWFFDGSASTEQREHMVRSYETTSYFSKIFILSVKSGGVGLDLKSTTIGFNLASKWAQWNNSGLLQAEARMYRANTMGVKRMYTFNTGTLVEQCVHHAVVGKKLFSQFLFYSEESIKKEIELYLNALEARCIKTEVDLSIENMEERKAKIHELFVMVREVVNEAPPKYFESFQKRLSMATDLNYNVSQESISRSMVSPKIVEKGALNTEGGVKRKSGEKLNEVNKGKRKKTGVLTVPASNTEISHLESKSSLPQVSNHSSEAAPIPSAAAPIFSATASIPSAAASLTSASASLTVPIPSFNAPSAAAAFSLPLQVSGTGNVSEKRKKYNSFSNRVSNFNTPALFQSKLSQSGQGIEILKTHYEVGVSGGNKLNLSIVPLRDCFDIKHALQVGVGVSKNGQKMGSLLRGIRALPSQEWQSLLEDPEAFMKTNHQSHDLNVNAVKTMVPDLFGIEQHASQSPISQEEILKNYNSDIYVLKDGKLTHEKGLRATHPTPSTCTIRLLKLPLGGNPNHFKFHLLMK